MPTPRHAPVAAPRAGRDEVARGTRRAAAALVGVLVLVAAVVGSAVGPAGATTAAAGATRRVDLAPPTFTNPTEITNPLFPAGTVVQTLQLGAEGDVALRQEITRLVGTRVIRWRGQDIETVVSQFVAYGDGDLLEVATDYFAQADDGSVWYLGEDVANYEDGEVVDREGTWLAGRDGRAGMIMPAHPRTGDVYRPENIPGLVFETVTVKRTDLTVDGPTGPVTGAILVQERLMDGTLEDKVFAPGYGEFTASVPADDELVHVAVSVPVDAVDARTPPALERLTDTARRLLHSATDGSRPGSSRLARQARQTWDQVARQAVPPLLADQVDTALDSVDSAVRSGSRRDLRQAAITLELAALDLEVQYVEPAEVDRDRVEVWILQRQVHLAAGDRRPPPATGRSSGRSGPGSRPTDRSGGPACRGT